ncbi:MAG: sigma-54-dependent Fis family transcriptional regulator [Reinekea sp.]|jgi:sigma-54 dependent transcriptional regulator, acetoin dehydrogenase operon transcriptional activator AcoR
MSVSSNADDVPTHDEQIKASWYRCEQYGLEHGASPELNRLSVGEVSSLKERHQGLLNTTENEVLPYYENILSNSACMIVLADANGHVLNTWGHQRDHVFGEHGLQVGNLWQEVSMGTNAIGTALATGQAVQVNRDEHFLRANRFMTGAASPIYDTRNAMLGVLDISSDAYLPQDHTLGMVKLMTLSVENRLIFAEFENDYFILTFNANVFNLGSHWSGILVLDDNGVVVSANRRAEIMLSQNLALMNITQIFSTPMRTIKSQPGNAPMQLRALNRSQYFIRVDHPKQSIVRTPDFRDRPEYRKPETIGQTTLPDSVIPINKLQFGDNGLARTVAQAQKIMDKDIPILVYGETGAGKEIFVRSLHYHSHRADQMFVAVNCAAIPSELVEAELFGYEKGAFTGANSKGSIGLIRRAHKGTLFLDEIGEMPLAVQSRLLRVLQERLVTPLGSTEVYPVDIKLISATNRQLKSEVEAGRFREDLYYRISGLNLELPPLRLRQDRLQLIQYVHQRLTRAEPGPPLSQETLALLYRHPWPGNIRQLLNVLKIALALADGDVITELHLPADFFDDLNGAQASLSAVEESESLEQIIPRLLEQNDGNVSRTAKLAGVSRTTVYKYMKDD